MPWEKQFDPRAALGAARDAFWEGGYEATSMSELLERMGIQKGSFYATFESKRAVLLESLRDYTREAQERFAALHQEASPRAALHRHLESLGEDACSAAGRRGCFAINAALELAPRDPEVRAIVRRALDAHERHYRTLLEAARSHGELPADLDPVATARALMTLVIGMRALARVGVPRAVIESARASALALVGGRGTAL
jgi:TetR/AcrR family transcriptional repressor of nem operon